MIYSLRWQLLLSMVAVILITVGMTAFFADRAANAEIERVQDRDDVTRHQRLTGLLSRSYAEHQGWSNSQTILEHASGITGERVVVADNNGFVVADSHNTFLGRRLNPAMPIEVVMPVVGSQGRLGSLLVGANVPAQSVDATGVNSDTSRPSLSVLLILSGLLAVAVAMILTFFVSHRLLAPIESLSKVSRLTAQRDFSARAEVRYRDEVGELARTFNSMVDELALTEELRRNLVADVAHELRTPVTNIRGYVEGMADGVIRPNKATLASMHSETILLTRLIEDLQELALAESGQMELRLEVCDLNDLAQNAVTSVQPQAQAKQVDLGIDESDQLIFEADPQRIGQVLNNLLANAVTHTSAQGHIRVTPSQYNGYVQVSIKDDGAGIPSEELAHVFERFYRVDKSRSRSTGGIGLGLTITKHLVEAHRGTIQAINLPQQGTEFLVSFPRYTWDDSA